IIGDVTMHSVKKIAAFAAAGLVAIARFGRQLGGFGQFELFALVEIVGAGQRGGERVPIPWRADAPAFGFSPDGESWLPQPTDWGRFAVDTQEADPESALAYYTELLHLRARYDLGLGGLRRAPEYAGSGVALINYAGGSGKGDSVKGNDGATSRGDLLIMTAFAEPLPLPEGWAVLLSSAPLEEEGVLPPDTTVYLVPFRTDTEE
ncbi:hypothetical protein R6G99_05045, partial [Actinotignum timonense]|nr:hypothetical protein [Actinotignum timonense]